MDSHKNVKPRKQILTDKDLIRKLTQIDQLAEEILEGLDTTEEVCSGCQHTRYPNWNHFKLANEVGSIRSKMQRWLGRLLAPPVTG